MFSPWERRNTIRRQVFIGQEKQILGNSSTDVENINLERQLDRKAADRAIEASELNNEL
jgi:hypothetical protein